MGVSLQSYSDPHRGILSTHGQQQQQSFEKARPGSSVLNIIDIIQTKGITINCCFDTKKDQKVLCCSGENLYSFNSFIRLLSSNPEIDDATILSKALNYLINGVGSQVITDPQKFRDEYATLYSYDPTKKPYFNEDFLFHLSHQEHYDTSIIEQPRFIESKLVFYIEMHHTPYKYTPYKVTCEWPVVTDPPIYRQETLPALREDLFK